MDMLPGRCEPDDTREEANIALDEQVILNKGIFTTKTFLFIYLKQTLSVVC